MVVREAADGVRDGEVDLLVSRALVKVQENVAHDAQRIRRGVCLVRGDDRVHPRGLLALIEPHDADET